MYTVQHRLRAWLERCRYLRMIGSFRRLQLTARGWLASRRTAAVMIQSVVRMWAMRRHVAAMRRSALVIQVVILLSLHLIIIVITLCSLIISEHQ